MRFYRRIRILPGIWLNFSKTGISITVGQRGFRITGSKDGVRGTIGLPGTGLSKTRKISYQTIKDKLFHLTLSSKISVVISIVLLVLMTIVLLTNI